MHLVILYKIGKKCDIVKTNCQKSYTSNPLISVYTFVSNKEKKLSNMEML